MTPTGIVARCKAAPVAALSSSGRLPVPIGRLIGRQRFHDGAFGFASASNLRIEEDRNNCGTLGS